MKKDSVNILERVRGKCRNVNLIVILYFSYKCVTLWNTNFEERIIFPFSIFTTSGYYLAIVREV